MCRRVVLRRGNRDGWLLPVRPRLWYTWRLFGRQRNWPGHDGGHSGRRMFSRRRTGRATVTVVRPSVKCRDALSWGSIRLRRGTTGTMFNRGLLR